MELDADMIDWSWSDSSADDEEADSKHQLSQDWRASTPDAGSISSSKEGRQRFLPRTMQVTPHFVEEPRSTRKFYDNHRDMHDFSMPRTSSGHASKNISDSFKKMSVDAFKKALYPSSNESNGESATILEYRKRIQDLDQQWKQQTEMNAKMEELLRMQVEPVAEEAGVVLMATQEVALNERDDKIRSLEVNLKENEVWEN
eukprot:761556-Hanusia_phi.AAC.8